MFLKERDYIHRDFINGLVKFRLAGIPALETGREFLDLFLC